MTNLAGSRPQLEEKPTKFVPGQPDMWMFVLFESLLFAGYFSVYLVVLGSVVLWLAASAPSYFSSAASP